jgi:intracellular sulfur oxidation DsrE/DsrF family protein
MQRLPAFFIALTLLTSIVSPVSAIRADEFNDARALADLKMAKGVFLVDIGDPKKLAFYLDVIKGTHAGMVRQNVTPDLVAVFIGPSVPYLTTAPSDEVTMEHEDTLEKIAGAVADLNRLGVRQEVCAVATKVFNVDNKTVLPALKVVGDGFISLIGYQTQGYALVPVY